MSGRESEHGCPGCARLERDVAAALERIAALEAELAKAKKNSSNSSKPPSSDIVNPPPKSSKPKRGRKRTRGAQPGHPRHERPPFPPEQVDATWMHFYDGCPCCGGKLSYVD